jgi:hypothetical protein
MMAGIITFDYLFSDTFERLKSRLLCHLPTLALTLPPPTSTELTGQSVCLLSALVPSLLATLNWPDSDS